MTAEPTGWRATSEPFVSVIVPVRDNPAGVRALLQRLAVQTMPQERFEILIADDGSRPASLAGITSGDGRIRVLSGPPRTSYAARNRAAAAAHAPVLAFCDSDCLPEPGWLAEGLAALEEADIVAGEVTFMPPVRPTVWSLLTIDMFLDQERNVRRSRAVTANLFVRRRDFARWGAFNESLASGGDFEFVLGAVDRGARLVYAPRSVVRHPTLDHQRAFLRKIWKTSRWAAIRRTRAGWRPQLASMATFVPVLGVALARRRALRAVGRLAGSRLRAAGLVPSWWGDARALFVLYAWVGWVGTLGRLCGWLEARGRATGPGSDATEPDATGTEAAGRSGARRT